MVSATRGARLRPPLWRRSSALELLDGGELPRDELERNLADLARMNGLPGGHRASTRAIARLLGAQRPATILDVGTGGGDMPVEFAKRGWEVIAIDADPAVVDVARAGVRDAAGPRIVEADARALPFADAAFDVAHASLLIHHLDPAAAVIVLREMARVARLGVVINDLRRGILPLMATATAVTVFGRCRTTRHDGLLSVRRAYRVRELDELLDAAGLEVTERTAAWMPRLVTTAVRRQRP